MLTPEQIATINPMLEDLDLQLRNGNVPGCKQAINLIATDLKESNALDFTTTVTFINDALVDHLFRTMFRTLLPFFITLIHSHQPKADEVPE